MFIIRLALLTIAGLVIVPMPVRAYSFDYTRAPIYQFPPLSQDQTKHDATRELMDFLTQEYKAVIGRTHYKAEFEWLFDWNMSPIGAGSNYYDGVFSIMLWGGLVRAEGASFQVIALTLCHEFGHYLGGRPKARILDKINGDWSSSEGQSDWFSATQCLPKVYDHFASRNPDLLEIEYPQETTSFCAQKNNPRRCQWIMSAGINFAEFVHYYHDRQAERVSIIKQAPEAPDETLHTAYPSTQCRLDTYRQGALCASTKRPLRHLSNDANCLRPRCWFNPNDIKHN